MKLLLDTHVLLWAVTTPERLGAGAHVLMEDATNELFFSVVSLWETAIKYGLRRNSFGFEPRAVRRSLLQFGYQELTVTAEHVLAIPALPHIHRDPFDRLLIAQAVSEGARLLTADTVCARYGKAVLLV